VLGRPGHAGNCAKRQSSSGCSFGQSACHGDLRRTRRIVGDESGPEPGQLRHPWVSHLVVGEASSLSHLEQATADQAPEVCRDPPLGETCAGDTRGAGSLSLSAKAEESQAGRVAEGAVQAGEQITDLSVADLVAPHSHRYLWAPNALLADGLKVLESWGPRTHSQPGVAQGPQGGGSDGRGAGFYLGNVTELVIFGTRGQLRTLAPARHQVNLFATRRLEHSRKPDGLYEIIERCFPVARSRVIIATTWDWGETTAASGATERVAYTASTAEEKLA